MSTDDNLNPTNPGAGSVDRSDIDHLQRLLGQRYQLQWIIGHGGMSTVWLAKDTNHTPPKDVAVKILRPEYTENTEFRTRFRNEAEAAMRLNSPNIVTTYDYGEVHEDTGYKGLIFCYIVMEYIKGEALADVLGRQKTLSEPLVADLLAQAATGLEEIHRSGMVHRDIKPGNLLITTDGRVKVSDFGIAKAAEAVPLTRTGMVVGTAQYVSPEQAQGLNVEPASDVYSLGVVGYECLAGRRPFTGETTVSVAIKHISEDPSPLPHTVSPQMREFIAICLRKDPASRYADGKEMASAMALVADGHRPPQPDHVPNVSVTHPLTEQLGAVATGTGTSVPPMQGPTQQAPAQQGSTQQGAAQQGPVQRNANNPRNNSNNQGRPTKKNKTNTPLILTSLLALAAIGVAGYLYLADPTSDTNDTETTTITSEITTPETTTSPLTTTERTTRQRTTAETTTSDTPDTNTTTNEPTTPTEEPSRPQPTTTQPPHTTRPQTPPTNPLPQPDDPSPNNPPADNQPSAAAIENLGVEEGKEQPPANDA
ncbi:protein kinase [Corynebacterium sp. zg254]|uniref:non-specific serine/threonine protein kinase n=1 Tax=Corynebacterium zhongnanshanii TaxID=2768834 RepID=A0ABQ6VBR7_9CORY|nr:MULTISPECIES: serine/threonine-protein kinase [Corynebacterium]KAB3519153.1 serine/threonine protein kinase [Corynebacterium zhongnanshanii]MCR5914995.1 protein kinase [Corynebacterium sp. zg254]